jgi:hypothetical protein
MPIMVIMYTETIKLRGLSSEQYRPPLVGEVSINFYGQRMPRGQGDGSLRQYFLDQSCYFFFQVAPQLYSRG